MFTIITVLVFFVCILMILIVLVQNSKGGGLASNFSSANQVMGVRKTTDFLEKGTWTLAGALLVCAFWHQLSFRAAEPRLKAACCKRRSRRLPSHLWATSRQQLQQPKRLPNNIRGQQKCINANLRLQVGIFYT